MALIFFDHYVTKVFFNLSYNFRCTHLSDLFLFIHYYYKNHFCTYIQFYSHNTNIFVEMQSILQKKFMTTTLYKRSKQYFDINRLNRLEMKQELSRRKPQQASKCSIDDKLEESFFSTQTKLHERVQTQLDRCQHRNTKEDNDETETTYSLSTKKGKTLDMSKMLSRDYKTRQNSIISNQRQFCNFKSYEMPNHHTVDFDKFYVPNEENKLLGPKAKSCQRCKDKQNGQDQGIKELNSQNLGKIHDKLIFDNSIYKTLVDFKRNDKQKSQRKQQTQRPEQHLQRIYQGEQLTNKKLKGSLGEFYHGTNKWEAPQMDNRLVKQNEYFLKIYNKKNEAKIEWSVVKRKIDLIEKRRKEIMARKTIKDIKGQTCDQKFFRRNKFD